MTTQSNSMVAGRIDRQVVAGLQALLSTMNVAPGRVNAANSLVPFEKLENIHFARFVILDDQTYNDLQLFGLHRDYPLYLAFLCDFDGDLEEFFNDLVRYAGPGLRRLFSFCEDFAESTDLLQWMRDHNRTAATSYVNWRGRTVKQIHEEAKLRQAIDAYLEANDSTFASQPAELTRLQLRQFVDREIAAERLTLTPPPPTPLSAKIANALHLIGVVILILLVGGPVLLLVIFRIRSEEKSAPVYAPPPTPEHVRDLAILEDYESTNQFSVIGSLQPGLARRWVVSFVLWVVQFTALQIYNQGWLARVRTIHFARWVFLDDKQRIYFASNYDGSLDSYMDDFINKVGFGLNLVFSNSIGYPATRWLLLDGASDEQKFKYVLRRHQLPTQVWYNAHPGITAIELERNGLIRQGLEAATLSEEAARDWVRLL